MTEFYGVFLYVALLFVVILQGVERYFFAEQKRKEQQDLVSAFLSKNPIEYAQSIKEKTQAVVLPKESDDVDLSQADDEVFDKFIKNQNS